jgi:hypothetical protein
LDDEPVSPVVPFSSILLGWEVRRIRGRAEYFAEPEAELMRQKIRCDRLNELAFNLIEERPWTRSKSPLHSRQWLRALDLAVPND